MGRETIPAKTTYTCDRCKATSDSLSSGAFRNGYTSATKVYRCGRDYLGNSAGTHFGFDLCSDCTDAFLRQFLEGLGVDPIMKKQ